MGLIQDNDTLTEAAVQEMLKIPFGKAGTQNKIALVGDEPTKQTKKHCLKFANPFQAS